MCKVRGMKRYSIFSLVRNAWSRQRDWQPVWRYPEPKPAYDVIMNRKILRGTLSLCLRPERVAETCFVIGFRRSALRFLRSLARLPDATYTSLTYEQLCADPERIVGAVLDFLGQDSRDLSGLRQKIQARPRPPSTSRVLRSPAAVRLLRPYLQHCGYHSLWPDDQR